MAIVGAIVGTGVVAVGVGTDVVGGIVGGIVGMDVVGADVGTVVVGAVVGTGDDEHSRIKAKYSRFPVSLVAASFT